MIIHVHTIVRNDAYHLRYFLRYYAPVADALFVMDDGSTDETPDVLAAYPHAIRLPYPFTTGLDEGALAAAYAASVATYSRGVADWVLCPDVDEHLYHPDLRATLAAGRATGARAVGSTGYFMVADAPPETDGFLHDAVPLGYRYVTHSGATYDKTLIYDPALTVRFGAGRHTTALPPGVPVTDLGIRLLHFCYLGWDYIEARLTRNHQRMLHVSPATSSRWLEYRLAKARTVYARARAIRRPVL
jgi:hypothetical protein